MGKKDISQKAIIFENEVYRPESKFDWISLQIFDQTLAKAKEKNLIITGNDKSSRSYSGLVMRNQSIYSKKGYTNLVVECRALNQYYTARINWGLTSQKNKEVMEFKVLPIHKRGRLIREKDFKEILNKNLEFVLDLEK